LTIRLALFLALSCCLSSCRASPVFPSSKGANPTDAAGIVGELAVAFLNRFSTSTVSPEACLVDFTKACRGAAEELSDITYNRAHFEILGARLGTPSVSLLSGGTTANILMACSWDSRTTKCEDPGCVVGTFGSVGGTCILTGVREASGWKLCTSNFSGTVITPSTRSFFGVNQ
jgi:hypothetical protein